METEGFAIYDAMMQLKNEVGFFYVFASAGCHRCAPLYHMLLFFFFFYVVSCSSSFFS